MDTQEKVFGTESFYELVYEGSMSNIDYQTALVIESEEEMQHQFATINRTRKPGLKLPVVDFKKEVLIFAYAGRHNSGGYSVDVSKVNNEDDQIHFYFTIQQPQSDMVSMSLTSPFKIIRVERDDKKITASF